MARDTRLRPPPCSDPDVPTHLHSEPAGSGLLDAVAPLVRHQVEGRAALPACCWVWLVGHPHAAVRVHKVLGQRILYAADHACQLPGLLQQAPDEPAGGRLAVGAQHAQHGHVGAAGALCTERQQRKGHTQRHAQLNNLLSTWQARALPRCWRMLLPSSRTGGRAAASTRRRQACRRTGMTACTQAAPSLRRTYHATQLPGAWPARQPHLHI